MTYRRDHKLPLTYLIAATVVISSVGAELIEKFNFHHPANLLWLGGIPVGFAYFSGGNAFDVTIRSLILIAVSLLSVVLFAYLRWGGI